MNTSDFRTKHETSCQMTTKEEKKKSEYTSVKSTSYQSQAQYCYVLLLTVKLSEQKIVAIMHVIILL